MKLYVAFLVITPLLYGGQTPDEISQTVKGIYSGNFLPAVADPITGKTNMSTIDGSKQFDAKISCGSAYSFLELNYTVGGASEISLTVKMDKDGDGSKEYNYASAPHISGVCQNGIVSCDTGTWQNCKYYQWGYSNGLLLTQKPLLGNLATCYCTNASCGSQATTNKQGVLDTIGNGVYAVVSSTGLSITKTAYNPSGGLEYYGQSSSKCGGANLPSFNPTTGYTFSEVDTEVAKQSADPNSAYTALTNSMSNQNITSSTCKIQYIPILNKEEVDAEQISVELISTPSGYVSGTFSWVDKNTFSSPSGTIALPEGTQYIRGWGDGPRNGISWSLNNVGESVNSIADGVVAMGWKCPTPEYKLIVPKCIREWPSYQKSDSCQTLAGRTDCKLKEEKLCDESSSNCQNSYQNFTPVNNAFGAITSSCTVKNGLTKNITFCVDGTKMNYSDTGGAIGTLTTDASTYWNVNRTYQCDSKTQPDMTDMTRRFQTATSSASFDHGTSSFSYTDTTKNPDGSWKTFDSGAKLQLPNMDEKQWCEVKYLEESTTVFSDSTNKSQTPFGGSTWKFERRTCDNGVCPFSPAKGEIVTYPCGQTTGDFAEAVTTMEAIGQAAKDMICSQN